MRLALTLAFAFALTVPAMAQVAPSKAGVNTVNAAPAPVPVKGLSVAKPTVQVDLASKIGNAIRTLGDQVEAAVRQVSVVSAKQQQVYEHFAYSVYAPICVAHKGLSTGASGAVNWVHPGEAWPATVYCTDGYSKYLTGPTP